MSYTIHEVAEKMGISTYSIRYYHEYGMLPFVQRDAHNNRVFEDSDLEWLNIIVCLRATGMSVERIKHYLDLAQDGADTVPERYEMMKEQQAQTLQEIQNLQQHLATINFKVAHYAELMENHEPDSFLPSDLQRKTAVNQ